MLFDKAIEGVQVQEGHPIAFEDREHTDASDKAIGRAWSRRDIPLPLRAGS